MRVRVYIIIHALEMGYRGHNKACLYIYIYVNGVESPPPGYCSTETA